MTSIREDVFHQTAYRVRFEWGEMGVRQLAPSSRVVVVIDVLSFTTCVEIAVSRGAIVFPYRYKDASAISFAETVGAQLADKRGTGPSLSPGSLLTLPSQSRIVLPSLNGSTCSVVAAEAGTYVIACCLRNASAVADFVKQQFADGVITIIACGEHWSDGRLRPAMEDLIGAGAILSEFDPQFLSPEAKVAVGAFQHIRHDTRTVLEESSSGRELIEKGFPEDVEIASQLNVSQIVPVLKDGAYIQSLL